MDLAEKEKQIARQFIGKTPWFMIIWWGMNLSVWFMLWPLTLYGLIPLWSSLFIASICACLCYLPSHEAQHGNIMKRSSPYFWINELVGYISVIPLLSGYRILRETHMLHHKYTNHPEKDPDITFKSKNFLHALWVNGVITRQSKNGYDLSNEFYQKNISKRAISEHLYFYWFHWILMISLAWTGHGLVALCIWWIPRMIGTAYLQITLGWLPHRPMEKQGRYKDTRGWKAYTGTMLTQGMEYHIIHHLYPSIPLHKTPSAFRDMKHILEKKNCVLDGGI